VKITLPGHGPNDLTKKHVGMIMRQLKRIPVILKHSLHG
jgi:hypothetical protein